MVKQFQICKISQNKTWPYGILLSPLLTSLRPDIGWYLTAFFWISSLTWIFKMSKSPSYTLKKMSYFVDHTFSHGLKYWNCGLSLCHRPFELSSMTGLPFQTKLFWIQTGRGRTNRELLERVDKECKSAEKSFQRASRASLSPLFRDRTLQGEICVDGNSAHSQSFWSQSPETPT